MRARQARGAPRAQLAAAAALELDDPLDAPSDEPDDEPPSPPDDEPPPPPDEEPEDFFSPAELGSAALVPDDSPSFALVAAGFPFDDRLSVR